MDRRKFFSFMGLSGLTAFLSSPKSLILPSLKIIKPKRLRPGDTVALINPAGATAHPVDIEIVKESMEALGLKIKLGAHLMDRYGYLAGKDKDRASDVNAQFADPSVSGVVAVRGGWGCARILPFLDFELIRRNPKILIGYSDVTALLLGVYAKTSLITFHGPCGLGQWNSFTVNYLKRVLFDAESVTMRNPIEIGDNLTQVKDRIQTIVSGKSSGRLVGGNLTVLTAIIGSEFTPNWKNAILFLEDVNEEVYRIDRMLTQLKLAGVLDQILGFVFGKCTDCDPGTGYGSLTLEQVFDDHIKPLGVPSWHGSMIGHISKKFTVPIGIKVEIDSNEGTIRLLEPAVL
jgi:muramoyltetrapeptide carboxypeptidase